MRSDHGFRCLSLTSAVTSSNFILAKLETMDPMKACLNSEDLRQNLVEASLVWTYMLKGGQEVEERRGREDIRRVWTEIKYT